LGDDRPFSPAAMGALGAATGLAALAARSGAFQPRRFIACLAMAATMIGATFGGLALFQRFGEERLVIRDRVETPFDPSSLPSPLGAHRHYVRDLADTSVIEVEGLPSGVDIRLAVMDTFDGVVWSMSGPETSGSGAFVRPAATDDATADGADFEVQVSAAHLEGVWLPTCGNPVEFVFDRGHAALAETLRVNTATGTALLMDGLPPTLSYTQLGVAQVPPSESEILMASAATVPLPEASPVPDAVASAAVELTGQATTAGELAFALARGLRENGYFSDGAAVTGPNVSLAGHGYDRIKAFLEAPQMVGNSEQYASAMALMARSLGLSSRVVLGFSGSGVGDTAEARSGRTVFTGADLEAWVEVSLDQLGWVTFHPTPPKDKTVTESDLMQQQDPEPNRLQPPLPKPAQPAPPDLEIGDVDIGDSDEQEDSPPSSWLGSAILVAASVLGSMLVLTAPLVVIWLIKRLRRRRRSRASPATERIRAGWREIVDALTDLRSYPPPRSTRLEQAAALAERFDPDTQLSLVVLARAADEAQFAPFEQSDVAAAAYWDIWYQTERSILRQVGPRARWRFKISSRSLRRRGRRRA
jgi:hypothetical protein